MGRDHRINDLELQRRIADFERKIGGIKPHKVYEESGCPMCGGSKFGCRYCTGRDALDSDPHQCPIESEHLHVVCGTCQYGWLERTLAQSKEGVQEVVGDQVLIRGAAALVELKSITSVGNFYVQHPMGDTTAQHEKSNPCPICQAIIELEEVLSDKASE
jgi:hypothetical protein